MVATKRIEERDNQHLVGEITKGGKMYKFRGL